MQIIQVNYTKYVKFIVHNMSKMKQHSQQGVIFFFFSLHSYADNELNLYPLVEVGECCVTFETIAVTAKRQTK